MPSIQITSPTAGQQFSLQRDPMNFQVVLPQVNLSVNNPSSGMRGDALVVRATENPPASTKQVLQPTNPTSNPADCPLKNVMVVGAPTPGGGYESFKVAAWARIDGVVYAANPVSIQIKVI